MTEPRRALRRAAQERLEALEPKDRERWEELLEDAATDFQRACLEAALLAGNRLVLAHAFADAIRSLADGALAEAVRPLPGDSNQDPLRAFQLNGNPLSPPEPRRALPPRPWDQPPFRLMDLTGGVGPPRYGNILDVTDAGARVVFGPSRLASGSVAEEVLNAIAAPLGLTFTERKVSAGKKLADALGVAVAALARGTPVPVLLGGAEGEGKRPALLLQVDGDGARLAFQLHDPFANETVWVNHRDLEAGRELPFEDKALRRITAMLLPLRVQPS